MVFAGTALTSAACNDGTEAVPDSQGDGSRAGPDGGQEPADAGTKRVADASLRGVTDGSYPASITDSGTGPLEVDASDAGPSIGNSRDAAPERDAPLAGDAGPDEVPLSDAGAPAPSLDPLRTVPYPAPVHPAGNPFTPAKALLGKILFWEEQLSGDDTVACGTCHRAAAGGSDPRSADAIAHLAGPDAVFGTLDDIHGSPGIMACDDNGVSTGQVVQVTERKAPSYFDAMFARRLFWDGRAECAHEDCPSTDAFEDPDNPGMFPLEAGAALENQAVGPPLNTVEMACEGTTWPDIHAKLASATPLAFASDIPSDMAEFITEHGASYPDMFRAAFGDEQTSGTETEINTRRIAFAIATHERRLTSNQTPYDAFNEGDDQALTPAQLRGLRVFRERAQCSSCHLPPLFTDGAFHFTGFHNPSFDPGRGAITGRPTDNGEMRTPTLRNVGLREAGGLLHNGAGLGSSLREVIETYVRGGLRDDPEVIAVPITESIEPLDLTEQEIDDLVEFIASGLTDPRVASELPPFDRPRLGTE